MHTFIAFEIRWPGRCRRFEGINEFIQKKMTDLDMSFAEALKKHRAGDLRGAEIAYRALLSDHPVHAATLHFFGLLLHQRGKSHEALPYLEKSLQINSSKASFYNNHGVVLMTLGRPDEAEASFRKAIELENINARIKTFKIMSERYRNHHSRHLLRMNLVCAVLNLELKT